MGSDIPEHNCLVMELGLLPPGKHKAHNWWYTSSGGGHQMEDGFDPIVDAGTAALEKNLKQWHCPGRNEYDTP